MTTTTTPAAETKPAESTATFPEVTPAVVTPATAVTTPGGLEVKPAAETKPSATTTEAKPAEKPAEPGKEEKPTEAAKPVVPEKYDLKLPKDSILDPTTVEKIASFAKERGLSNEQAQAVLERESESVAAFQKSQNAAYETEKSRWVTEAMNDKEYGGAQFKENSELAFRAVDRFGSQKLKDELNRTGLGNHPELVRAFVKIGKAMANDKFVHGGTTTGETKPIEDIFYPKQ